MLGSLPRLNKLSSARIEFGRRGMLHNDVLAAARLEVGDDDAIDAQGEKDIAYLDAQGAQDDDGLHSDGYISLGEKQGILLCISTVRLLI